MRGHSNDDWPSSLSRNLRAYRRVCSTFFLSFTSLGSWNMPSAGNRGLLSASVIETLMDLVILGYISNQNMKTLMGCFTGGRIKAMQNGETINPGRPLHLITLIWFKLDGVTNSQYNLHDTSLLATLLHLTLRSAFLSQLHLPLGIASQVDVTSFQAFENWPGLKPEVKGVQPGNPSSFRRVFVLCLCLFWVPI